jgi:hypothetical protein
MSSRVACGEHSSDIIRTLGDSAFIVHTSISTVLQDIKQIPDCDKGRLLDSGRPLEH